MCGICFTLLGISIKNIKFCFNPFEYYVKNKYVEKHINLPLLANSENCFLEHIIQNNLILNNFISLNSIENSI